MRFSQLPRTPAFLPAVIAISYAILAATAIALTRRSGGIALMWLANGPLIAALAAVSYRRWTSLIVAALIGSIAASLAFSPLSSVAPIFAGANIGEAMIAAWLIRRFGVDRSLLNGLPSIGLFVVAAAIAAPLVSGAFAAFALGMFLPLDPAATLFDWQLGHGIGNLITTPLALLFARAEIDWRQFRTGHGAWRAIGCLLLVAGTAFGVFYQSRLPLLFLPIVPLLVATFSMQRFGAAGGVLIIALVGGVMTLGGSGPTMLIHGDQATQLQLLQFYLAVLFMTAMPVAATLRQRDRLTLALRESEARYRLLADNATDIMLTLDPDGTIRFASPSVLELGYFEPDALIGVNAATLVYEADRARVSGVHIAALRAPDRTFTVEYRATRADGSLGWFEANTRAVQGADGTVGAVVSALRALDERKEREAELVRAAATDPLTGLLNRAAFRHVASEAMAAARQGTPSTLALLDLDHFKAINDTHGHGVGDRALLMAADLLREHVRAGDVVGRVGGEEFAILFRGLGHAAAAPICDRIRSVLSEQRLPGSDIGVTMSAGLAELCPGFGLDPIFAAADRALYRAKAAGRNRIAVESEPLSS
ncbi:MAG: diguanylate cyclase [Sphingomonas sp.]|jgi:diguanylate cyclase (GGDEF)-like protein/PAS domain S-box-containing protein|uniref:sensor domain-containing diguanylate cyclase n=1 Tax=Sphingomonas sp. TaxID=28214 RepID=UPI003561AAAD